MGHPAERPRLTVGITRPNGTSQGKGRAAGEGQEPPAEQEEAAARLAALVLMR
jgi:hypothetical protein